MNCGILIVADLQYAMAVCIGVPFALLGVLVVALRVRGMSLSIAATVGFIALCGIAVLNGVVMASEIRRRRTERALDEAIVQSAGTVLQPLLFTATVAALRCAPLAMSSSAGSEVQRPLAKRVIGGLTSSTLLGILLLPGLVRMFRAGGVLRTMFLREVVTGQKTAQPVCYAQIVESYRDDAGKSRHRVLLSLGRVDRIDKD